MADSATRELIIRIKGEVATSMKQAATAAKAEVEKVDAAAKKAAETQAREAKKAAAETIKEAQRAYAAFAREEAKKERDAKRAADAAAREAKRTADAQAREAKKAADAMSTEAKRAADAQAREAKKSFDASFVSLQSLQSAAIDTNAKIAEAAKKRAETEAKLAQKLADAEAKKHRKSLTDEEVNLLAKNKLIQSANQKRIDSAAEALNTEKKGFDLTTFAAGKFSDMLSSVAGQFTLLSVGNQVLSELKASWDLQNSSAAAAGRFIADYRKDLLEIAALKGRLGNTTAETRDQLTFRAQTLQSADQARAFQEAMIGSGAAAVGRQITQTEFDKLMVESGKFQAAEGGSATAQGQLAGMLPLLMGRKNVTASEAMQKQQQIYDIIQLGGSTYSSGVQQLLKGSPLTTSGVFRSVEEQAALQSAFSLSNREGAGENVQQFARATVGSLGRMRGSGVMVDEKQAEYLKRLGATDQMSPTQIGKLISSDFAKQEAEAAAKGKTFNPMTYMMSKGYQNQEDIQALMSFHGLVKSGQYGAFEERAANLPNAGATSRKVAEFQAADPEAQRRKAELAGELSKTIQGVGPMEYYNSMQERAYAQLVAEGKAAPGAIDSYKSDFVWGGKLAIEDKIKRMLLSEAKAAGMSVSKEDETNLSFGYLEGDQSRAKKFYDFASKVGASGGSISPDLTPMVNMMQANVKATEKVEQAIRTAIPGGVPPALPAAPAPPMKRP